MMGYNPHVIMDTMTLRQGYTIDTIIGITMVICTLIGLPGNALALTHFARSRRNDVATLLYLCNCTCDLIISLAHIPVTVALLHARKPGVMNELWFCATWAIGFFLLQKIGIFFVMLLSVFRTLAIVVPFWRISKKSALAILIGYIVAMVTYEIVWTNLKGHFLYLSVGPFCFVQPVQGMYKTITIIIALQVGLPSIITILSLVTSTSALLRETTVGVSSALSRRKQQASVTITLFTALFICCNSPYLLLMILEHIRILRSLRYPGPYLGNEVVFWYVWPISSVLCITVNAAVNPLLYMWRMKRFRRLVCGVLRGQLVEASTESVQDTVSRRTCRRTAASSPNMHRQRGYKIDMKIQ